MGVILNYLSVGGIFLEVKNMLRILKAKMIEKNISDEDIASLIGRTSRAVRGKIAEETSFLFSEAKSIHDRFFAEEDITTLFSSDRIA
jgi:hypothetical protein